MRVCGLTLLASTMRSRNCPSLHRAPAPARSGAMLPWNLSSGNGPKWQSRHSPVLWLATIARPRAASPWPPVNDAGMASPTVLKATSSARPGAAERMSATATIAINPPPLAGEGREGACGRNACASFDACPLGLRFARHLPRKRGRKAEALAENLGRRGAEPGIGIFCFLGAQRGWRIERAGVDRVVDFGVLTVHWMEFAGDRNGVAGRDDAVTVARHRRGIRRGAGEEADDRGGAEPAFDDARERRLRHRAGEG